MTTLLLLYSAAHVYTGARGWQSLRTKPSSLFSIIYFFAFALLAISYPLGNFMQEQSLSSLGSSFFLAGSYWLGMIYYLFLFTLFIDILRFIDKYKPFIPLRLKQYPLQMATAVFLPPPVSLHMVHGMPAIRLRYIMKLQYQKQQELLR